LLDGDLEMMARVGFVVGGRGEAVATPPIGVFGVDVIGGWARPVGRSRHVVLKDIVLPGGIHRLHSAVLRGAMSEEVPGRRPPPLHLALRQSHDVLARLERVRTLFREARDGGLGVPSPHARGHLTPFLVDSGEFLATSLVDLAGR